MDSEVEMIEPARTADLTPGPAISLTPEIIPYFKSPFILREISVQWNPLLLKQSSIPEAGGGGASR